MDDTTKVIFIVSIILACDVLSLVFFTLQKTLRKLTEAWHHDQEWNREWTKVQTRLGYLFCLSGLLMAIGGAAYFHMIATWTVEICPTMMEREKCSNAVKTYRYILWWLILPTLIARLMIFTSIRRAKGVLLRQPQRLYALKHHVISMGLMQLTLLLSLPLAYPYVFYPTEVERHRWAAVGIVIGSWMIVTYEFGVAFWIEGASRVWMQPQHRSLRLREHARGGGVIPLVTLPHPTAE